ncbi:hypothetical protein HispidOSU_024527, partial [Sigmodon hispidus]
TCKTSFSPPEPSEEYFGGISHTKNNCDKCPSNTAENYWEQEEEGAVLNMYTVLTSKGLSSETAFVLDLLEFQGG